jgi:RIO kinase 1
MTNYSQAHLDSSLEAFFAEGLIARVLQVVKSGKEATVYCCQAGSAAELLAAKVYRPLEDRDFRNDAAYSAGRDKVFGRRDRLALAKKSRHGRDLQYGGWIGAEYQTLEILHAAGATVPRPISRSSGAILMEYFGDRDGAAPMLSQVSLERPQAIAALRRIIANVALALRCDRVHADLSPFNILYWQGDVRIIDFPQAVDPRSNGNARSLLCRDLENVCKYFRRSDVDADPARIADELWQRYRRAAL